MLSKNIFSMMNIQIEVKGTQCILILSKKMLPVVSNSTQGAMAFINYLHKKNIVSAETVHDALNQIEKIEDQVPFRAIPGANRYCTPCYKNL